jgi:hypothetical protein
MLYRPSFCCNCGEKIVRDEWRIWTSRRFCPLCETELKGIDLLPRVVVGIGLLFSVAAFATYVRKPAASPSSETAFKPSQQSKSLRSTPAIDPSPSNEANNGTQNTNSNARSNSQINEQPKHENRTSDEAVFFCGAITKKGTPCTRRVKTKGTFCWQHAKSGQIAPARF